MKDPVPNVYMAGSMSTGIELNWRAGWRPSQLPDAFWTEDNIHVLIEEEVGAYCYCGPYGDGMTNHTPAHGIDAACGAEDIVHARALAGIKAADIVCPFVEPESHGTLYELGYASALGKPIYAMLPAGLVPDGDDGDEDHVGERRPRGQPVWQLKYLPSKYHTELWFALLPCRAVFVVAAGAEPFGLRRMLALAFRERALAAAPVGELQ